MFFCLIEIKTANILNTDLNKLLICFEVNWQVLVKPENNARLETYKS